MGRLQDNQYAPLVHKSKKDNFKLKQDRARDEAKLQATFCPPLDPSLIQAIWNDTFDFNASFTILTSLAQDADQTLDQQQQEQHGSSDEQDESVTTTTTSGSVTTNVTSESEDENITFLCTCFPTLSFEELIDALKSQDDDVEKATDLLLNREFIQSVERDNGILVEKRDHQLDYVPSKQSKYKKKKVNNNSKAVNKKSVWSSGQLPNTQTTQGNKTVVDFRRQQQQDEQDAYEELASVPFNFWHQYDSVTKKLQKYFKFLPEITVAACVQHCRGNIIASVKLVMEKHPTEKPEHEFGWTVVKDLLDIQKELEIIMVDRTPEDIYRISIGVIIEYEGQGKTVDQLIQSGIEHFLSFDINQLELEARLKKLSLENEAIQLKKKQSNVPVIPEYLLLNNQSTYVEDDPEECRDIAMQLILERNELFKKAAQAYRQAKNKGKGESGIAFYYSDNARQIDSKAKDWNMRAARATVRSHRIKHQDDHLLDLHGLTVSEAQVLLRETLNQWWSRSQMQSNRTTFKPLKIITGVGKHSQYGESKLLPSTLKILKKEGWSYEQTNPGCFYIKGIIEKK